MSAEVPMGRSLADVAEELMAEYGGQLSLATVSHVVLRAQHDLQGQVTDGARSELLYRLARQRLGT